MSSNRVKVEDDPDDHPLVDTDDEVLVEDDPMQIDDDNDEDDDPVVREIDVYMSPGLAHQLYLLQYPLQPAEPAAQLNKNHKRAAAVSARTAASQARIRPQHGLLEIDHPIPNNLLPSKNGITKEGSFAGMASRTFQSQTIPVQTHLCLGKFLQSSGDDDSSTAAATQLHLVPLNHIRQMRPSFRHVDDLQAQNTTTTTTTEEEERQAAAAAAAAKATKDKKPLVFQRKESERAAMARKSSYAYKKSSEESEAWLDLKVNRGGANHSDQQRAILKAMRLGTAHDDNDNTADATAGLVEPTSNKTTGDDDYTTYIQSLNYQTPGAPDGAVGSNAATTTTIGSSADMGKNDMKTITARLTTIMYTGYPMPFSIIRQQFEQRHVDNSLLFKALTICAVQVRGNYCLNSRFLPALSKPVRRARTLILMLLNERGFVQRRRLLQIFQRPLDNDNNTIIPRVSAETLLVILEQVARKSPRHGGCWVLKIGDDTGHLQDADLEETHRVHQAYWEQQSTLMHYDKALALYDA